MFIILLGSIKAFAANISVDECAIGDVKAGWYSNHHYLPEKFNNTALKDVDWVKSSNTYELDNYPKSYVIGMGAIPCERISNDNTFILYGTLTRQAHSANAGILEQILGNRDPLYISVIEIVYRNRVDRNYKILATSLQTPRGIKLQDSKNDVIRAYGDPDYITYSKNGDFEKYWYYTPKSLQLKRKINNYLGAGILFSISVEDGQVYDIAVFNTYGYPTGY